MKLTSPLLFLLAFANPHAIAAGWPQFRGPNATGVSSEAKAPGPQLTEAWKIELPGRGLSSPIVVGDKLFLTCSSGPDQASLHVFCFSASDGKKIWERVMRATGRTMSHNKTCVAAPTPCSDGKSVFALFSSNDLFAFDLDGNLQWLRGLTFDYANASNSLGMSQSPLIVDGVLVVQSENDSESFAAGLDVKTGRNLWKLDRPKAANWTSAVAWKNLAALQSSKGLLALEPRTGKKVWEYSDGAATIPSTAVGAEALYVPSHGLTAITPEGDSTSQLWRAEKIGPGTASPVVLGDHVYVVKGAGILVKASLKTGDQAWDLRLNGPFSGSPVAAGSFLYIASERGHFQVVDTSGAEGKITQTLDLKETILSTPAIANGAVFIRSDKFLWKLQ